MNVREVMTPDPRTVMADDSIQDAAKIMREEDTGVVPVVAIGGHLIGIVTDRDIVLRSVADGDSPKNHVQEILTKTVFVTNPEMTTKDCAKLMAEHQVRRLPVVVNGRIVGIVSLGDLAVREGKDALVGDTLEEISEGVKVH